MKNRDHIDAFFSKKLSDHEESVPPYIWDNIADKLDKKQKRKRIFYIQSVAASVAILLAFLAGYFLTSTSSDQNQMSSQETPVIVEENNEAPVTTSTQEGSANFAVEEKVAQEPSGSYDNGTPDEEINTFATSKKNQNTIRNTFLAQKEVEEDSFDEERGIAFLRKMLPADLSGLDNGVSVVKDIQYPDQVALAYVDVYRDEEELEKSGDNNWLVGGSFSPVYAYRNAESNEAMQNGFDMWGGGDASRSEAGILSYSGGVNVGYQITERLDVYSGVYYSEIGQVSNNVQINEYQSRNTETLEINTSMGDIETEYSSYNLVNSINEEPVAPTDIANEGVYLSNTINSNVYQYIEYLEVPLLLKYKIIDRKFGMNLLGGFSTSFLVGNQSLLEYDDTRYELGKTQNLETVNYNSRLGLGLEYDLTKAITFSLEPTFKYALNSINSDYKVYPYSFAVFTGLHYRF